MVYKEFEPNRVYPLQRANWAGELAELQQSALDTIGWVTVSAGYIWSLVELMAAHPRVVLQPLILPLGTALLGTLVLVLRRPLGVRRLLFVGGGVALGAVALLVSRFPAAPFVALVAISGATLIPGQAATFVTAAVSSALLVGVAWLEPGRWSVPVLGGALALYWANATASWLTSRNLRSVLRWALQGYEESWRTTRELQVQRGKLNRTLKDLADANLLLKRTTYDLAEAREEAERARQMKAQFAANISHELRTPLHLIVGFSQMMHMSPDNYAGVTWSPELRGDVAEIYESATHLLHLIDDVLDLSQIEAARLPVSKERIVLAPLIRETVETARSLLRDGEVTLHLDLPDGLPAVYADPTRMRQILLNLLNNAARFTERGSITVEARLRENDIEVAVADTGIGMPEDQLQEIFEEFHQVDGTLRRKYGGTGLGLALCRQFVHLHGGQIWAESRVGEGSTFHFTIPLPDRATPQAQASLLPRNWRYPASKPRAAHRLVILARPPEFPRLLARYLPDTEVVEARDDELAAVARRVKADAIVLPSGVDNDLEEELAGEVRDLSLPVITCSWPLEQSLAAAQGFAGCLMKPFGTRQLLDSLDQVAPTARRLLVVDDDPGVGRLAQRALQAPKPDLEIDLAFDGTEAIRLLDREPDVVLLDLILPGVDGLGVLRELRQRPGGLEVPVIAITARSFAQDMASLGSGQVRVRRGTHFTANEITRWLAAVCQAFPARHLEPGGPGPEPAPVRPG
ncbi:MAG: hybrid sensor histidine kinase/response regulator [Anaerolineae bacterium]|nr:hybrid sensor histidine kinase/response regulator [Anaerolineae bacterium]